MNLDKIIDIIRKQRLNEDAPTMSMSGGGIAGSAEAGDDPPVGKSKKKKKKYISLGRKSRRAWMV